MVALIDRFASVQFQKLRAQSQAVARETQATEYKTVNGLGQLTHRIPRDEFIAAMGLYGHNCWQDPDFLKAYLRDNPHCRVTTNRGTRGQELHKPRSLPKGTIYVPPKYATQ